MSLTGKITKIANAIRNKTNTTETMTLDEMPTKIASISSGSDPILQDKSITITENGTITIKPDEGYDGLNIIQLNVNVASGELITTPVYLIKEGVEQTDVTGGHIYQPIASYSTSWGETQHDDYISLYARCWNSCKWVIQNKIDFSKFGDKCRLCVDYSFSRHSSTSDYQYAMFTFYIGANEYYIIKEGVGVAERNTYTLEINSTFINNATFYFTITNLTDQRNYTDYCVNIYNVWLEGVEE